MAVFSGYISAFMAKQENIIVWPWPDVRLQFQDNFQDFTVASYCSY